MTQNMYKTFNSLQQNKEMHIGMSAKENLKCNAHVTDMQSTSST